MLTSPQLVASHMDSSSQRVLEANNVSVRFGGVHAVTNVSMHTRPGQVVGLIGPNGGGKTTFLDALTGFVNTSGDVKLAGQAISRWPADRRVRSGLVRTWQSLELFSELTVLENLQVVSESVAGRDRRWWGSSRAARQSTESIMGILTLLGIPDTRDRLPQELSHGERKIVSVARSLAGNPLVLCLDEPAAGLDRRETSGLGERLRSLVGTGLSVLLVDHDMGFVLSACDWIYVIQFGAIIASGTPAEIRADERVIAAYLGTTAGSRE
jgi:branched-chain amino acid transport system ATP-binding protein